MKRLNPVRSLPGFILTILLFVGLGVSLWFNRGLAFNPGPVTAINKAGVVLQGFASHAEFEKQCGFCHEPLKSDLANKCKSCHIEVNQQILSGKGVHSQIDKVNNCSECHADHLGRTFNPTQASYNLFDHSSTSFNLNWHQQDYDTTPMECFTCHKTNEFTNINNQTCYDCHANHDLHFVQVHAQDFGANCLDCHDGSDRMQNFDHGQTGFPLVAKHAQINCTGCHKEGNIKDTPVGCKDCHIEPSLHQGLFEQTCESCHTADAWSPAIFTDKSFSHLETAGFSLDLHKVDYYDQVITCSTCHPVDFQNTDIQTCVNCHNEPDKYFMADHQEQFGPDCVVCHDGVDRLSNFDHGNFFSLEGTHLLLQCSDCHIDKTYRGTPKECWQCHAEPEIHSGVFGSKCFYCHSADSWSPASLRQHGFPLNHSLKDQSTQLECNACHGTNFVDYTCYTCHDHEAEKITQSHQAEGISDQDLPACVNCHPNGTINAGNASP
jgi:hypothetical protein